jgi:hypothetical protein
MCNPYHLGPGVARKGFHEKLFTKSLSLTAEMEDSQDLSGGLAWFL